MSEFMTPPCEDDPFEVIQRLTESNRQLREELEKVKAAEHPWAKALAKKWLDPECSDGCQSLKHKHRIECQDRALAAAKEALEYAQRKARRRYATTTDELTDETTPTIKTYYDNALARIAECEKGT